MPALFLLLLRVIRGIWKGLKDPDFRSAFFLVAFIILTGAWFYHVQEGWSWLDSFYFTIITLTTVGYGDFSPQTDAGKIFTMVYIILGLGIVSGFIILVAERSSKNQDHILERFLKRREESSDEESEDV